MNRAWRHTFPLTALFPDALPIGSQRVRAICPDPKHAETHPSCVVNYHGEHGWTFHCFSCGAHGDALDVLTGRDRMTVREAMELLGCPADHGQTVARSVSFRGDASRDTLVICDACRNETAEFSKRRYGRDSREWTASADLELATLGGWELSANLEYAIGPRCLAKRKDRRVDNVPVSVDFSCAPYSIAANLSQPVITPTRWEITMSAHATDLEGRLDNALKQVNTTRAPILSLLDTLAADFEANYKGKTTDKRKGELVKALTESQKAVAAAEKALEAAKNNESAAVAAIIREASGRARITIKGETFSPASRGSKVYLRKVSAESIELA